MTKTFHPEPSRGRVRTWVTLVAAVAVAAAAQPLTAQQSDMARIAVIDMCRISAETQYRFRVMLAGRLSLSRIEICTIAYFLPVCR